MANVKIRAGSIRNVLGAPLSGKVATLRDHATDLQVGSTVNTDPNGQYSFTNLDETIRYRVEVAFGGGSSQMHVNAPISPDLDHAYINSSLRSAASATVAFGGPVSVGGALTAAGGITGTTMTLSGALNAAHVGGGTVGAGDLGVTGTAGIETATIASLYVTSYAQIDTTLEVNAPATFHGAVEMVGSTGLEVSGGPIYAQDGISVFGGAVFDGGNMDMASGAIQIDASGNLHHSSGSATFDVPVYVAPGSLAAPAISAATDPDTGLVWVAPDILKLAAGGLEIARVWKSGANTQFGVYGSEAYFGVNKLMFGATVMSTAASVTGVVRKILVCDGLGNFVGWVPVYGAAG